jgi:hypothetical protein
LTTLLFAWFPSRSSSSQTRHDFLRHRYEAQPIAVSPVMQPACGCFYENETLVFERSRSMINHKYSKACLSLAEDELAWSLFFCLSLFTRDSFYTRRTKLDRCHNCAGRSNFIYLFIHVRKWIIHHLDRSRIHCWIESWQRQQTIGSLSISSIVQHHSTIQAIQFAHYSVRHRLSNHCVRVLIKSSSVREKASDVRLVSIRNWWTSNDICCQIRSEENTREISRMSEIDKDHSIWRVRIISIQCSLNTPSPFSFKSFSLLESD